MDEGLADLVEELLDEVGGLGMGGGFGDEVASELGVHFEGFQFARHADGGGAVFEEAVGLDEGVVFAKSGGAGKDEAGEEGEFLRDGEGGFFAGEFVASAAEFLDVGADGGGCIETRRGSMGDFAAGGFIAGQDVSVRGGLALGDLFSKGLLAT
jgi:hypothetical protein